MSVQKKGEVGAAEDDTALLREYLSSQRPVRRLGPLPAHPGSRKVYDTEEVKVERDAHA